MPVDEDVGCSECECFVDILQLLLAHAHGRWVRRASLQLDEGRRMGVCGRTSWTSSMTLVRIASSPSMAGSASSIFEFAARRMLVRR